MHDSGKLWFWFRFWFQGKSKVLILIPAKISGVFQMFYSDYDYQFRFRIAQNIFSVYWDLCLSDMTQIDSVSEWWFISCPLSAVYAIKNLPNLKTSLPQDLNTGRVHFSDQSCPPLDQRLRRDATKNMNDKKKKNVKSHLKKTIFNFVVYLMP